MVAKIRGDGMTNWIDGPGLEEDVVVSTRIRVARNLDGLTFPHIMSLEESKEGTDKILRAMEDLGEDYEYYQMEGLDDKVKVSLVERHLISPKLIQSPSSSFFLKKDGLETIMVNEEDHLRIQVLSPGLNLMETWKRCSKLDDLIEKDLNYAFSEKYGYLTTCPTNVGTGLRASVMLHLPGLSKTGHIRGIGDMFPKIGLTIRGIYGEGSNVLGDLYQISNQTTLGESEEETIDKLNRIIRQILKRERETQKLLVDQNRLDMENEVYRSLGILKYSRKISVREAMDHLSNIKLGVNIGFLPSFKNKDIVKLMVKIQPASLQLDVGESLSLEEQFEKRSCILRKRLKEWEE